MRRRFLIVNLVAYGLIASFALTTGCGERRGRVRDHTVIVERDRGPYRRDVIVEERCHDDHRRDERRDDRRHDRH